MENWTKAASAKTGIGRATLGRAVEVAFERYRMEELENRVLLSGSAMSPVATETAKSKAIQAINLSSAVFVENQGQWADTSIKYAYNGQGINVGLTDTGPVLEVLRAKDSATVTVNSTLGLPAALNAAPLETEGARITMSFDGAQPVVPVGVDRSATSFNYLVGDESQHRSNVAGYQKISYAGLYQGIDFLTWGKRDGLKYEFHVAPGADWRDIAVSYGGTAGLSLAADGSLHVATPLGDLVEQAPILYQMLDRNRVTVAGRFVLLDADTYGIAVTGAYDASRELVIDPDLAWATYLGGSGFEAGQGIAIDGAGNAYVTGATESAGWATAGAYANYSGGRDAFVAKLSPSGMSLLYATYLGGSDQDYGFGIAVDGPGNAYVTGLTFSAGWATALAYDTTYNIGVYSDAFAAKLNASGSALLYATYLGGNRLDSGLGIAVDPAGNAYVTGQTGSDGWTTAAAYDTTYNGGDYDAFVAKLNASGSSLLYATYLGGSDVDIGYGIAVDPAGNAYVTGETGSAGWATVGAYDVMLGGDRDTDAFVAKLNASGSSLLYATYLGGSGGDVGYGIAVDGSGNAYVTGETSSVGWATAGAYDVVLGGDRDTDAFVAKLNASGSSLLYATYLGGSGDDYGYGIAVDGAGNAYVTGETGSVGWATEWAYDVTFNGKWDAFMAKLSASGSSLLYATYLGGSGYDSGTGIAVDVTGNAYVAGYTESLGLATTGAYSGTYNGGYDAFAAKLNFPSPPLEILARALVYGNNWHIGEAITQAGQPLGYKVDAEFRDDYSGFYAFGLTSDIYGPAIIFRGSDGINPIDWFSNSDPRGVGYDQFERNWTAVEKWLNDEYLKAGPIDFAGQSLGGALTQWFASKWTQVKDPPTPDGKLIDQLVTFNSPGIRKAEASAFNKKEANSVTHYVVNGDIASMAGEAFIVGRVEMASWPGWEEFKFLPGQNPSYKADPHQLPLTVPVVTFPADTNDGSRFQPAGITWQSFPDVTALNSPTYVHTSPEYNHFLAEIQLVAYASAFVLHSPKLVLIPALLKSRATVDISREIIGEALRKLQTKYVAIRDAADRIVVSLVNTGNAIYDETRFILDQGVTVSLSTTNPGTLDISGGIGMDYPKTLPLSWPSWLGGPKVAQALFDVVSFDASGTIKSTGISINGKINLLGGAISVDGMLKLDWSTGAILVTGNTNLFNGFITATDTVQISGFGTLEAGSTADVTIPSGWPLIGGLTLINGGYRLSSSSDDFSKDYIAAWGTGLGTVVGLRVFFNGSWEFIGAATIPPAPAAQSPIAAPAPAAVGQSFIVPTGVDWALLETDWQIASTTAAIRLTDPNGRVYSEADLLTDPNLELVADLDGTTRRVVKISDPTPGLWRIELVDATGLGVTSFNAMRSAGPASVVSNVAAAGGVYRQPVDLSASISNATASTRVALYYDQDNSGTDGVLIAGDLAVIGGNVNYTWTPESAPVGPLYVYAVVTGDNEIPSIAYSAAPVTISEYRPAIQSANFDYIRGNAITIQFTQDVGAGFGVEDVQLTNLTTGVAIPSTQLGLEFDSITNVATLNGITVFADGNYRLQVLGSGVSNGTGSTLTSDLVFDFFVLNGDVNRDHTVGFADLVAIAQNYGKMGTTYDDGDVSGDGVVGFADLVSVAQNYGKTLPLPPAAASAAPPKLTASRLPSVPVASAAVTVSKSNSAAPVARLARATKPASPASRSRAILVSRIISVPTAMPKAFNARKRVTDTVWSG